ncbi:MAG: hypothetical protein IPJ65_12530 [Archangiaceae bacterium]|nr:hypothetical protein [Archangiaceae bacterium]
MTTVEVRLEVVGKQGHEAGCTVPFIGVGATGRRRGEIRYATTDVMGFARVTLEPGTYRLNHEYDRLRFSPEVVVIEPTTQTLEVRLLPSPERHTVSGTVVDGRGQPLVGAEVGTIERLYRARRTRSDVGGAFSLEVEGDAVTLFAAYGGKKSLPLAVKAPTTLAKLRILTESGRVTFRYRQKDFDPVFIQYTQLGATEELRLDGKPVDFAPGHHELRARAVNGATLYEAWAPIDVKADIEHGVTLNFRGTPGPRVQLADPHSTLLPGVTVMLVPEVAGEEDVPVTSTTDSDAIAVLLPARLGSFDPLYRVEVKGNWRTVEPTRLQLGNPQLRVTVRPYDAALDATSPDAGGARR